MRTVTKRAAVSAAALLLSAGMLTACSNGSSGDKSDDTGGTSGANSTAKIGLLLPDTVTPRYATADYPYFKDEVAAKCPKCEVLYQNAAGSAATQQQQAQAMITQGVKVLVLDPFDGEAAAAIVTQAKAKNIPVISYDRLIDSGDLAAYISFDNEKVGKLQAQALVDRMKELGLPDTAGILEINGSPTDNNASQFKTGAQSVLGSTSYKVLGEYDTPGWDPAKAQQWASGQISKVGAKNVQGVYAANDDTGGAAIAALKAAGITKLPPVTGQDASLAGIQRILAGEQYMTVYKAFKPEASKAADMAVDLANGTKPDLPATVKTAKGASVPAELLDPVAVTTKNIADTVVKDGLYKVSDICTAAYKDACDKAGIK
ncbi:substrate-binding domain-containing protein [Luteimicrobium sp. NPDC057192]|uniref:substrate-binding domain-containing protein n=1 Tax=Luteimicrobium sp. NPDC057192 TaxID=3346042 RepID=UPI00362A6553